MLISVDNTNHKLRSKSFAIFIIGIMFICALSGCSRNSDEGSVGIKNNAGYELYEEPSGDHYIGFCILMSKYQIFIPNDFKTDYKYGSLFEEGIDCWTALNFKQAEINFSKLLEEINTSGEKHPDDKAFVEEALGCLYIEMAKYSEAYDLLMDALVSLKNLYGENVYYPNTASVNLCHYYYATGDYDGCLKEIQRLKDNDIIDNYFTDANTDLKYYIQIILNDLEANIDIDRGKYVEAYNLCNENLEYAQKFIDETGDNGYSAALYIHTLLSLGDVSTWLISTDNYFELAEVCYDKAINLCDYFKGSDYGKALESQALLKKGFLYVHAMKDRQTVEECYKKAKDIQESLYSDGGGYPGLVETYRSYAEFLGFIMDDEDGADEYFNKSLELGRTVFGDNHPELAKTYASMGRYYGNRRNQFEKAMDCFGKGIQVYENLLIENNPMVANMYLHMAGGYGIHGDKESSDECLEKAYKIYGELGIKVLQADGSWK